MGSDRAFGVGSALQIRVQEAQRRVGLPLYLRIVRCSQSLPQRSLGIGHGRLAQAGSLRRIDAHLLGSQCDACDNRHQKRCTTTRFGEERHGRARQRSALRRVVR